MQSDDDASLCNGKDHATVETNEPHRLRQPPPFVVHPLVLRVMRAHLRLVGDSRAITLSIVEDRTQPAGSE